MFVYYRISGNVKMKDVGRGTTMRNITVLHDDNYGITVRVQRKRITSRTTEAFKRRGATSITYLGTSKEEQLHPDKEA